MLKIIACESMNGYENKPNHSNSLPTPGNTFSANKKSNMLPEISPKPTKIKYSFRLARIILNSVYLPELK